MDIKLIFRITNEHIHIQLCDVVPLLSLAESELDSSFADELEIRDSVDDSTDLRSRSRSGLE